jgi:hypothetical protein
MWGIWIELKLELECFSFVSLYLVSIYPGIIIYILLSGLGLDVLSINRGKIDKNKR